MNNLVFSTRNIDEFISDVANEVVKKMDLWNVKSNTKKYMPISKFCKEYDMTRANLYNLDRKEVIKLKKLGGKTFVDVKEVEEAMKDFISSCT